MNREIYLDNSATTLPFPEVAEAMIQVLTGQFGNPSSLHSKGVEAEELINRAREQVARSLGAKPSEVIFTSGGTEANNLALLGVARKYRNRGNHIITSVVEHSSVIGAAKQLETEGFEVTYLPVDTDGRVQVKDVVQALRDETILVSIMFVNNETGTIQPIAEIAKLLENRPKTLLHVDAVQAYGKFPFDVKQLKVDLLSISSHKIHGPKGCGALYIRDGIELVPLVHGGGQEKAKRPGTQNVPGIVGFGTAVRKTFSKLSDDQRHLEHLRDSLITLLHNSIPDIRINTPENNAAPHVVNVSFPGVRGEVLVHALESEGIFVSTGSACSSKQKSHSPVLQAIGLSDPEMEGSIRISLSAHNEEQDIREAVSVLGRLVSDLRLLTRR